MAHKKVKFKKTVQVGKTSVTYFKKKSYRKSKKKKFKKEKAYSKKAMKRVSESDAKIEAKKKKEQTLKVDIGKPVFGKKEEVKGGDKFPLKKGEYAAMSSSEKKLARQEAVKTASAKGVDVKAQDVLMATGAAGLAKGVMSVGKVLAPITKKLRERSISKLALRTGYTEKKIASMVAKAEIRSGVRGIVKGLSTKKLASMAMGFGISLAGTDVIMTWYALDNVITGQKFFVKDILAAVKSGSISPDDARKKVEQSTEIREMAIMKVNQGCKINPMLWAFRNLILTGVEADQLAIELITDEIEMAAGQAESTGMTGLEAERAESEEYYAGIEEKKKAGKMEERAEEEKYYAGIEEKRKTAKAKEREEDEAYWAKIRAGKK